MSTHDKLGQGEITGIRMWDRRYVLGDAMCGGEDPLSSDEGSSAEVLVEGVDEGHLPAPLGRVRVFAADDARRPRGGARPGSSGRPFHAADVLAVHWRPRRTRHAHRRRVN